MVAESLHGGWDLSLCQAVKVKPDLYWRLQEIGDVRATRCMPRRTRQEVEPAQEREKSAATRKLE